MQYAKDACTVVQSLFFFFYSLSLVLSYEIEEPFIIIMLYRQGNDASTHM